jgi:hypothetical protein
MQEEEEEGRAGPGAEFRGREGNEHHGVHAQLPFLPLIHVPSLPPPRHHPPHLATARVLRCSPCQHTPAAKPGSDHVATTGAISAAPPQHERGGECTEGMSMEATGTLMLLSCRRISSKGARTSPLNENPKIASTTWSPPPPLSQTTVMDALCVA